MLASGFIGFGWAEQQIYFQGERSGYFHQFCQNIDSSKQALLSTASQAKVHSCDELAEVGIALYAGSDLGKHKPEKVGQWFDTHFKKHGINTKVFIKHDHEYGSSMSFYVSGTSLLFDVVGPVKAIEKADYLAAEAKLILFANQKIAATEDEVSQWITLSDAEKATWKTKQ